MNKIFLLSIGLLPFVIYSQTSPSLTEIPVEVFINDGVSSIEDIFVESSKTKSEVRNLFDGRQINHELALQGADFNTYWETFANEWHWVKFRKDEAPLLLFLGLNSFTDEKEYVEIYDPKKESNARLFAKAGRLIAYKKHPLTNELILYSHKYPCCRSASHNIYTIRKIHDEIKYKDRFFIGRDSGDMTGPFFPDSASFNGEYEKLEEKTVLRWSPEVVEENAFIERAKTNAIIHYEKGAIYKKLAEKGDWHYVIMYSGISEEMSPVINHLNFKFKGVYGWIKQ
jgi:hypothetical protein